MVPAPPQKVQNIKEKVNFKKAYI